MRPNGFGGAHFRPPSAQPALAYPRQDSSAEQAGPDLLSPPGSAGPQLPVQNGWHASGSNSTARALGPPQFGAPRLPAGHLAGDLNNLSLNGGPAQSSSYYSQAPIGGGEPPPPTSGLNRPVSQMHQAPSSKIDPTQVPRPSAKGDAPEEYRTSGNQYPNPPTTQARFVVRDTGNANPRFMRCTLSMVPYSSDLLKQSAMPLAVVVQPFALLDPADDPTQTVDFGESGPIRVDFVASKEYMVRPPMPFVHFFLIDVSYNAVTSGALQATCSGVARVLNDLQGNGSVQIGIATFDTSVHFYTLSASQSQAHMLVMPDIEDVYSLSSASVVVPLQDSHHLASSLLESIPKMFSQTQHADACVGAAVQASIDTLKEGLGGKLHVFMSSLPKLGLHGLTPRHAGPATDNQQKQMVLLPAHKGYQQMAEDAAEHQVSIDLFVVTRSQSVELASLAQLCEPTAGQLYHYCPFVSPSDDDQLYNDLRWNVQRPQGLEAVARMRCSLGLVVDRYLGSFHRRTATDIDLPAINADQSIAVQLRHDDKLDKEAFLQFVVLYTTTQGERRIRVHNLALPTTQLLGQVFKGADLDTQTNLSARRVCRDIPGGTLASCQDQLLRQCINQLFSYRKNCTTAPSSGQLILPEALKLLPFYSLGLSKSPCLRLATMPDVRVVWMHRFLSLSLSKTLPLLVPRLLPLHRMLQQQQQHSGSEPVQLPPSLSLSSEKLQEDGIYLAENGYDGYIYFAQQVNPQLVRALLGVDALEAYAHAPGMPLMLPVLDNPLSQALHAILDAVRQHRCAFMSIRVLKRGDPAEILFYNCLVEDKNPAGMSYIEFLCAVHRQIQSMFKALYES
ncbi:hypothetical protein WJX79_010207 [Trebouxia sp. C0005]